MAFTPMPNSGTVNPTNNQNPKAAHWMGSVSIEGDLLDYILQCVDNNEPVKIELSLWEKTGPKGMFMSVSAQTPYEVRKGAQQIANRYATAPRQEPQRGQQGQTNRYAQTAGREPAPEYRPVRGGIAEQAMGRPIMTSRGPYPTEPARGPARAGSQQNRQFRQELKDDLPDDEFE